MDDRSRCIKCGTKYRIIKVGGRYSFECPACKKAREWYGSTLRYASKKELKKYLKSKPLHLTTPAPAAKIK